MPHYPLLLSPDVVMFKNINVIVGLIIPSQERKACVQNSLTARGIYKHLQIDLNTTSCSCKVRFNFIGFMQENDFGLADRYADLAMIADRYNPAALTNKGNCVFARCDYEKAAEFYKEALRNDSSFTEALYNLGEFQFNQTIKLLKDTKDLVSSSTLMSIMHDLQFTQYYAFRICT